MWRVLFLFLLINNRSDAQSGRDPDPRATSILQQHEEKINLLEDVTYQFTLKIEMPEAQPQLLEGSFFTKGHRYRLEVPDFIFVTDGKIQWVVNKEIKEIQIHDYEPLDPSNLSHPPNLLKIYNNPDFDYRMEFEGAQGDRLIQQIEFKPLEKESEYSKARITINQRSGFIDQIELFSKDGSRYYLTIGKTLGNQHLKDGLFQVKKEEFPGFKVEDLRLN
jgi:outer membrane lipoprotein-sorting protein